MTNDLSRVSAPLDRPVLRCSDPSRTKQDHLFESLTLNILKRYNATGVLPSNALCRRVPVGDDFQSDLQDRANAMTELVNERINQEVNHVPTVVDSQAINEVESSSETKEKSGKAAGVEST